MLYPRKNDNYRGNSRIEDNHNKIMNVDEKRKDIIEQFSVKFNKYYHKMYDFGKFVRTLNLFFEKEENVRKFEFAKDFSFYEQKILEKFKIDKVPACSLSLPKINLSQLNITDNDKINDLNQINTEAKVKISTNNDILNSKSLSKYF